MTFCVELTGVRKAFGATRALDELSFSAAQGQITAVLGPNGAGKSTAMAICEGLTRADAGTVRVLGLDPATDGGRLRPRVGVMIQDGGLPVMARSEELLRHVARLYARPRDVDELTSTLGLGAFARTSVRRLSGGQRQRLAMAIALVGRPDLVFLDEPSAGMDPQTRLAVWEMIETLRTDGVSVLLTTHLMDEAARLADQVVIIDHGAVIAQGTVTELTGPEAGDGALRPATEPSPAAPTAAHLTGRFTPEARTAVENLARTHGLRLQIETEAASPGRTLEDVFLELTGRSLR
ncbi:ABC transporter ATP-binding protein [Ruania zhangjianzhongii]|uniref:ABC transporter ATP-binding protein n=1 Tax=Ruania zhangjianzhongii TaxID=2603206 RepID=UPI001F2586E6|nr:ABC transporter ATP-binding protein [Ruania zhangjianzhongii]